IISSGRLVNDGMGIFVAKKLLKQMIAHGQHIQEARVLIMGLTFKENCPDIRNTKVVDIYYELKDFGIQVDVYDPWAAAQTVEEEYGITLLTGLEGRHYDGIIVAVAHQQFFTLDIDSLKREPTSVVFDIKSVFAKDLVDIRL
ncbi:MAG TPA: UDP binding domain-containing protein, partial [Fibrella sp.]